MHERSLKDARLPDVSVVMPVLDGELYLAEAIESVLAQQSHYSWELLIVDDGSADRSLQIAADYTRRFPDKLCLLQHDSRKRRGASAARNLALASAQGEFLAFLDADDVWLPGMLDRQVGTLRRRPEISMVYAQAERWWDFALPHDPAVGPLGENTLPPLLPAGVMPGLVQPPHLLKWFQQDETLTPCTCTVVVRAAAARRLGGFEQAFEGLFDDQAFYAKFALEEPIWVNPECVARYRRHAGSTCVQAWEDEPRTTRERTRFRRWLRSYELSRKLASSTPLRRDGSARAGRRTTSLSTSL